jgi:hypothetical protein
MRRLWLEFRGLDMGVFSCVLLRYATNMADLFFLGKL